MLRAHIKKLEPKKICFRNFKNFIETDFLNDLNRINFNYNHNIDPDILYNDFLKKFEYTLSMHAPLKTKFLRGNNAQFMTKEFSKAIMKRSRLKNIFNNNKNTTNWDNFRKQRNICTSIKRKCKINFFKKELENTSPQQQKKLENIQAIYF